MMVVDATGKVAISFMDTMKGQPIVLALIVMNFALLGFIYMQSTQFNTSRRENVHLTVEMQREVQKLLAQCVVPPPPRRD